MKRLDSNTIWYFFIQYLMRSIIIFILLLIYILTISLAPIILDNEIKTDLTIGVGILLAYLLVLYIWAKLTWHFYLYEITENQLKIEKGIIWKHYMSIPYDRIQNIDIHRGILARLMGLSDLRIQTAGYQGDTSTAHNAEGVLPGLSKGEANSLRDRLVVKMNNPQQEPL